MEELNFVVTPQAWLVFVAFAVIALGVDLVSHRNNPTFGLRSSIYWSIFWVLISLLFAGYLCLSYGVQASSLFITGYVLEKALSVDNLFVMMAIFSWFKIPDQYRHRALYYGILGAVIFRGIFVFVGSSLLQLGAWVEMCFALIIVWSAIMMLRAGDDDQNELNDYSNHLANRLVRRFFPVWPKLVGDAFFLSSDRVQVELEKEENRGVIPSIKRGALYATPLLLCTAVLELSDVMFAFDSVPAVIAVSKEPLIVYSAMLFAILGLRTLYFVLVALKRYLVHLEKSVIILLFYIAFKLAVNAGGHILGYETVINPMLSLLVVLAILVIGVVASILFPAKEKQTI